LSSPLFPALRLTNLFLTVYSTGDYSGTFVESPAETHSPLRPAESY
jgi:hypothetical protein